MNSAGAGREVRAPGPDSSRARFLTLAIATGLGSGLSPVAPGTVGTGLAVAFYLIFVQISGARGGGWPAYLIVGALITAVGVWAAGRAEPLFGKKDAGQVVIDEIAGYWVTMFALPSTWPWALAGFAAFRLFDIWKPWPIHGLQRIRGGWGVMIDDLLAGIYACAVLHLTAFVLSRAGG